MRVKLGSVAFLKSAGSGYGIGLDDDGHLIEFLGDWRALDELQPALGGRVPVYLDVDDWAVVGVDDKPRIPLTRAGMVERARFMKAALAAMARLERA
jgi:hypothetical protein